MNKKQRIDSKLNTNNSKSNVLELHVLVANHQSWKPDTWQAWDKGASISIGFVKADVTTSLFELRSALIHQLRPETLPDQYIYLRHVGRGSTICSARQERSLTARDFAPPFYPHAEICILSAEDMVFHSRYRQEPLGLPAIVTSDYSQRKHSLPYTQTGTLPPVTPSRLMLNNTAPIYSSIERSKSPSFRSLQSLDSSVSHTQSNELMVAEINFLEAKRALADAHAHVLRSQYIHNNSMIMENGLDSTVGSDEGSDDIKIDEEEERLRKEEEEERRRLEDVEMQRLEEEKRKIEEEKRKIEEENRRVEEDRRKEEEFERNRVRAFEEERRQLLLAEEEDRRLEEEERKLEEDERRLEKANRQKAKEDLLRRKEQNRHEKDRRIEEEIRKEEEEAIARLKKKQEERRNAEAERVADLEKIAKEEEEEERRRKREEEERRKRKVEDAAARQKLIQEQEMKEFRKYEELIRQGDGSEDEEADRAMRLIDDLTLTPRPWAAIKDPHKKKIVRVPKEYSESEREEVAYLRAKIGTYRTHRKLMESKHHDLLQRLAEMEQNWNDDDFEEFESKWRPKCKAEEKRTPQLYEANRQLRLELQMLYKQADTIITHAQAKKTVDSRQGMSFPSIKNNLRINLQRIQSEVTEFRKRAATANIKYEAEKLNREGVEKEVKQLRQELINSKISSSVAGR